MRRGSFAVMGAALAAFGLAAAVTLVPASRSKAAEGRTFMVPVNDGYGVGECIASGSTTCGKVVADAWCEAQGFRRSASVGPADVETTGSIERAPRRIAVTCAP